MIALSDNIMDSLKMKNNALDPVEQFRREREERVASYGSDQAFHAISQSWVRESMQRSYVYNFDWLGRPIIQYPQDMVAMQELVWRVRPDLIIETGIAHGGSLILSASLLALLDLCDAMEAGTMLDPRNSRRKVLGVDIDIRTHNRDAIEAHPMASRARLEHVFAAAGCRGGPASLKGRRATTAHAQRLPSGQLPEQLGPPSFGACARLSVSVHLQGHERPRDQCFCASRRAHLHQPRRD